MNSQPNDLLLLAGQVLAVLMQIFMAIAAAALLLAPVVILVMLGDINAEIATEFEGAVGPLPLAPVLGLCALALAVVGLVFLFFGRLRAIIATVGEGDPFAPQNADRLNWMAWSLLAVQLAWLPLAGLGLWLAKWAEPMEHGNVTVDAGFDLSGIIMVVVLFILARVFRRGAAMREDLEGTV
ncbi:MAG: DUF2975 domain-containing protein [Pseudomonadota bacterium]